VIAMTETRSDALARLGVFIGDWSVQARFPGHQPAPSGAAGEDENSITGAWEKCPDGGEWEHGFALTYRRTG
jgi:hypothetical protein